MICFAAIAPHPVVSIPGIGKANSDRLAATIQSLQQLKQDLYASKPDTLVIISPHISGSNENFTINQSPEVSVNFKDFGDLSNHFTVKTNFGLGYSLRETVETSLPMVTIENQQLDHGSSVPLYHFLDRLKDIKIISLGTVAKLDLPLHYAAGQKFRRPLETTNERLAIIASADLSHDLPAGNAADNLAFDQKVITWLEQGDIKALLGLPTDNAIVQTACGLRPVITLLGVLAEKSYTLKTLSFEHTLGIGYYCGIFQLT